MKKLTHEEFIQKYKDKINKSIELVGKYNGKVNKIECRCLICDKHYFVTPDVLKQGCGHKECYDYGSSKVNLERQALAKSSFLEKLNYNIEVLEEYKTCMTKLKCKCKICSHEWYVTPNKLLQGRGCPKCGRKSASKKKTIPKEDFIINLALINPNIKLIGEYVNQKIKTKFRCLIDGYEWDVAPSSLLQNHGCPECSRINQMNTNDEFLDKLSKRNNHNIEPVSKYEGIANNITMKCNDCNEIFITNPHNLYHNVGCPNCSLTKGERRIKEYLINHNILFDIHRKFDNLRGINNGLLSYDFYLLNYNILIEYQGEFHDGTAKQQSDEEFAYQQEHDRRKREYAEKNNIELLEIWYWDYDNIEKILSKKLHINNFKSA